MRRCDRSENCNRSLTTHTSARAAYSKPGSGPLAPRAKLQVEVLEKGGRELSVQLNASLSP